MPQFVTNLDGVDIHFIRVRSPQPGALPLIMTHGWPGSIVELLDSVGPLTDPTAHGGHPEDAFDLVPPSMPGFGFSDRPTSAGLGTRAHRAGMGGADERLGYTRYVSQGGDWGSVVPEAMGRQAPAGLLGIHVNLPATVPAEVTAALPAGAPAPNGLVQRRTRSLREARHGRQDRREGLLRDADRATAEHGLRHGGLSGRPRRVDARARGFTQWTYSTDAERSPTKDEVLDDITLYWLTNTGTSAGRIYREKRRREPE